MAIKPLNSVAGFSVGETPSNIILANGDVTTTNITTTGVSNLNSIGNVRISGGTNGQVIQTDGAGNLTFVTIGTASLTNGTSNINVLNNGDIDFSVAGNANVVIFTGTGANINGYANITGNANVGNLGTGGIITATGNVTGGNITTAGQLVSSVSTGTAPLSVSSTTLVSNLNADLLDGYNSSVSTAANTVVVRDGNGNVSANYFIGDGSQLTGIDTSKISNGNSNVSIPAANGNVNISAVGNANVVVVTGTGANINGYANITGNANVGNLGAANGVFTTNVSVGSYLITPATVDLMLLPATGITRNYGNMDPYTGGYYLGGGTRWTGIRANSADFATTLNVAGNANVGNLGTAGLITATGNVTGGNLVTTGTLDAGNVKTDNLLHANGTPWDFQQPAGSNTQIQYNDGAGGFGANANFTFDQATNQLALNGNIVLGAAGVNQLVNTSNTYLEVRAGYGNTTTSNLKLVAGDAANTLNWSGIRLQGNLSGNSAIIHESVHTYWRQPTVASNVVVIDTVDINSTTSSTGALQVGGGIGVTGNVNVGGALSVTGNIANANNISATNTVFANNANITANLTSGNANLGNLAIASYVQTGEILNGNSNIRIAANSSIGISAVGNANVLLVTGTGANIVGTVQANGSGSFGSLVSPTLTSNSGALTLTAAAGNENIVLVPTGTGNVDVSSRYITSLADPTNAQDAATKAYVDSVATGLQIHPAVRVTSVTNLTATYANGGTSLTTTTISSNKIITFSADHGLSVDDEIYWSNSFNGITAQNAYFVETIPANNQITVRATYTGAEVTNLSNGTGLTQAALANPGVGATLTNAGANAALTIDSVALASTNRVLVQGQTNQYENGVYTVTTVGNGSTAWVLTRATDADQYAPSDVGKLGYGDYFFITAGSGYAGSSYVLTTPTGEITFGITNIAFSQFAAAGSYSAGNGIAINGTIISANTDGVTTDIVGGNIVVKTSAQLTTPNIGAATGTSLSVTGNVLAGNVNSNALVSAANVSVTSNVLANNFSANSNITSNNATINLALSGNTANFSGNVIVNNLDVNLQLDGNTANFTGNLQALYVQAGTGTPIANLTNPLFGGITSANNFVQAYVHNESNGSAASADFIAYPDNGDDISGWVDMGITSSTFNAAAYSVTEENEGYIFMSAPDGSGTSGNLVFATDSTGANNSIEFFVNGFNKAKNQRSMLINTSGVTVTANLAANGIKTDNLYYANGTPWDLQEAAGSNTQIQFNNGTNNNFGASANLTFNDATQIFKVIGTANVTTANVSGTVNLGNASVNTGISWASVTTSAVTANQTIASFSVTGITGVEFLVKGVDSSGSKYSVATVQAVTDGTSVDYSTFGGVNLGGYTGSLAVNIVGGQIRLQVTPASSNSTVWTTQYRLI